MVRTLVRHCLKFPAQPFALVLTAALATLSVSGCSGGPELSGPNTIAAQTTDALSALPTPEFKLPTVTKPPSGSPTDIYTRIARGALTCWLGGHGPLKGTHRFHARAEPPHKGGESTITIFKKVTDPNRNMGDRAYSILIKPSGTSAEVQTANHKLSAELAASFDKDVTLWAASAEGCSPEGVTAGWTAEPDGTAAVPGASVTPAKSTAKSL